MTQIPNRFNSNFDVTVVDTARKINSIIDYLHTIDAHNAQVTEEVWPKIADRYWFITVAGNIKSDNWDSDVIDKDRIALLGIYRTEAEALKAKEKIIKAVKGI